MHCRGGLLPGGCLLWQGVPALGGACYEGMPAPGGFWKLPRKQMATIADGTHPTGMHSCGKKFFLFRFISPNELIHESWKNGVR